MSTLLQQPRSTSKPSLSKPPSQPALGQEAASPAADSDCGQPGGFDGNPDQAIAPSNWSYVGDARGLFDKRTAYHYVGDGLGQYDLRDTELDEETVGTISTAAMMRKLCVCVMLAFLLGVLFLAATARTWEVHRSDVIHGAVPPVDLPLPPRGGPPPLVPLSALPTFDCKEDYATRVTSWSREKKQWCCATLHLGCVETTTVGLHKARLRKVENERAQGRSEARV